MTNSSPDVEDIERALASASATGLKPDEASALLDQIVACHRAAPSGSKVALAKALHRLGHARMQCRQHTGALAAWREAADLLDGEALDPDAARTRLDALIDAGGLLCAVRDGPAAQLPLLRAVEILRREPRATARLAWALNLLASTYQLGGDETQALHTLRDAERAARAVACETRSARDAATWALMLNNIGRAELTLGRAEDACAALQEGLNVTRLLIGQSRMSGHLALHSALSHRYGQALERLGRLAAALPCYTEAVEIMRGLVTGDRPDLAHDLEQVESDLHRLRRTLGGP